MNAAPSHNQKVVGVVGVDGPLQHHTFPPEGGIRQTWITSEQTKSQSAAWADLFTHKYQQADQSGATCDLRGSRAAIIIYRRVPAALMMEGTEGALTPNRLICCPTTSTTFDLVGFPLTKVVSLPVVADYSGSNYRFCSNVVLQNIVHPFWRQKKLAPCDVWLRAKYVWD